MARFSLGLSASLLAVIGCSAGATSPSDSQPNAQPLAPSVSTGSTGVPIASDLAGTLAARFRVHGAVQVVPPSAARAFDAVDGGLRPQMAFPGGERVLYPARARDAVEVARGSVSLRVTLEGALDSAAVAGDGAVVWRNAILGGDLVHVPIANGTEELLVLPRRPDESRVVHWIEPKGAAGLRQVGDVLEVIDATGNPVLRTSAPLVVDSVGQARRGTLAVRGCAVDRSVAPPWDRAPTPMGASRCAVETAWDDEGLVYPLLVDPAWTSTASMAVARADHASVVVKTAGGTKCATGCVLAIGGQNAAGLLSSTELRSPTDGTWAMAGALPLAVHTPGAVASGARVVVAGGAITPKDEEDSTATSAFIDFAATTPIWAARGVMPGGKRTLMGAGGIRDAKGDVAVFVGGSVATGTSGVQLSKKVDVFDFVSQTWSAGPDLGCPDAATCTTTKLCSAPAALSVPCTTSGCSSSLFIAGGRAATQWLDTIWHLKRSASAEWVWTLLPTASLSEARSKAAMLQVGGVVVIAGGVATGFTKSNVVDMFDATKLTGLPSLKMSATRSHVAAAGSTNRGVLAGGFETNTTLTSTSEVMLTTAGPTTSFVGVAPLREPRASGRAEVLGVDRFVVFGGRGCAAPTTASPCTFSRFLDSVEVFAPQANGAPCTGAGECASGFCVDGVCCNSACTGACVACSAALKGAGASGVCEPVAADSDPRNRCTADAPNSCKADGFCDGKGACRAYAKSSTPCGATTCTAGAVTGFLCNGSGMCVSSSTPCGAYLCSGTACGVDCTGDAQCAATAYCTGAKTCADKLERGQSCGGANECKSGFCADGVCCDRACTASCEACDAAATKGTCTLVSGEPRHGACDGIEPACKGSCRGASTCGYPGTSEDCGSSCASAIGVQRSCDGFGACKAADPATCGGYQCDGSTRCKTSCAGDADCADGRKCVGTKCVDPKSTCKADGSASVSAEGVATPCNAYLCEVATGACRNKCTSTVDCSPGHVCDASSSLCVTATPPPAGDDGGCEASRGAPRGSSGAVGSLLLMLAAVARLRRRG